MKKNNDISTKIDDIDLIDSMNELMAALTKDTEYLIQNSAMMEDLTLIIKRLDSALRKEFGLETSSPSLELKQSVTEFVKFQINPHFYKTTESSIVDWRTG